jgi:hypothetical protein
VARRAAVSPKPSRKPPATEKRRLWLTFDAEGTTRPLLWLMSHRYDVIFNVRSSSVSNAVGLVALELEGRPKTLDAAVRWFKRQGVRVDPVELNAIEG